MYKNFLSTPTFPKRSMNMLMNIQVPEYSASIALRIYEYATIL